MLCARAGCTGKKKGGSPKKAKKEKKGSPSKKGKGTGKGKGKGKGKEDGVAAVDTTTAAEDDPFSLVNPSLSGARLDTRYPHMYSDSRVALWHTMRFHLWDGFCIYRRV